MSSDVATESVGAWDPISAQREADALLAVEVEAAERAIAALPAHLRPRRTLADVMSAPDVEVTSLPFLGRDHIVVEGWSHLMASAPRVGKTELLGQAMIPWTRLGHEILVLTEERDAIWRDRAQELSAIFGRAVKWDRIQIESTIGAVPTELLEVARRSPADVVILDTLRHCSGTQDENDAAEVRRTVAPWLQVLAGRTVVALTHHRKQAGENGERVGGSVALPALFDVILELGRVPEHESRRKLTGTSRRHEVPEVVIERNDDGVMLVLGDGRSVKRRDLEQKILGVLATAGEMLTSRQIRESIGGHNQMTVHRALVRLAESQGVQRFPDIAEDAVGHTVRWGAFDLYNGTTSV